MATKLSIKHQPQSVKKFYFLEYFYVLLKSVQVSTRGDRIFEQFLILKHKHRLGESRYKKLTDESSASPQQMVRYRYTFEQVANEAEDYGLISNNNDNFVLTEDGHKVIQIYEEKEPIDSYRYLLDLMERKHYAFHYLINVCYANNPNKSGLLIFPIYSAYQLGIKRDSIKTSKDLKNYFNVLKVRLQEDINRYLGKTIELTNKNEELIDSLIQSSMLSKTDSDIFDPNSYNVILKRGRDFWLKYFLQDLYSYSFSLSSFDIWAYRGKQIGFLHITEFYPDPNFNGRLVYPLSVIRTSSNSSNFFDLYTYPDQSHLYVHQPSWDNEQNQEEFVQSLHHAYLDVRQTARSYFVNLSSVRERVCYAMRISEYLFDKFLSYAYHQRLKIKISLEVDKLPDETQVMYVQREPVMVDGKYRNIIAIDLA